MYLNILWQKRAKYYHKLTQKVLGQSVLTENFLKQKQDSIGTMAFVEKSQVQIHYFYLAPLLILDHLSGNSAVHLRSTRCQTWCSRFLFNMRRRCRFIMKLPIK